MIRATELSGAVLEPVTNAVCQVPSGTEIETADGFNEAAATLLISVYV